MSIPPPKSSPIHLRPRLQRVKRTLLNLLKKFRQMVKIWAIAGLMCGIVRLSLMISRWLAAAEMTFWTPREKFLLMYLRSMRFELKLVINNEVGSCMSSFRCLF